LKLKSAISLVEQVPLEMLDGAATILNHLGKLLIINIFDTVVEGEFGEELCGHLEHLHLDLPVGIALLVLGIAVHGVVQLQVVTLGEVLVLQQRVQAHLFARLLEL
jgi:hypothetical protein